MIYSIHTFEIKNIDDFNIKKMKEDSNGYIQSPKGLKIKKFGRNNVKLIVNPSRILGRKDDLDLWHPTDKNIKKMLCKLDSHIKDYINSSYGVSDFELTRCDFTVNINVGTQKAVSTYINVLHNIGEVTGFSLQYKNNPKYHETSFDLLHRDGIGFSAYDKFAQYKKKRAENILRIEVRLKKQKAIRKYTKATEITKQIHDLAGQCKHIFLKTFECIVPRGDYYTMAQAEKRVSDGVSHKKQEEKMLYLLELTRNKSLYTALKEISKKNHSRLMSKFAKIDVSPIILKKKHGVKFLSSLYRFLK